MQTADPHGSSAQDTAPGEIQTEQCKLFYNHWARWRANRLLPEYSDLRLGELSSLSSSLVLLRYVSSRAIVFRTVGEVFRAVFGHDLSGEDYLRMADPCYRTQRRRRVLDMITQPCGALTVTTVTLHSNRSQDLEYLSLPVASDETGLPDQVLAYAGPLGSYDREDGIAKIDFRTPPKRFAYLDIGAGLPARS